MSIQENMQERQRMERAQDIRDGVTGLTAPAHGSGEGCSHAEWHRRCEAFAEARRRWFERYPQG